MQSKVANGEFPRVNLLSDASNLLDTFATTNSPIRFQPRCAGLGLNRYLWVALLISVSTITRAELALQIGQNFRGSTLNIDSSLTPPDGNGVIGPAHFVELVNGRFSVYSKTNGARLKTLSGVAFWQQAGTTLPNGWEGTDPRVVYDPVSQRWFGSEIDLDLNNSGGANHFLLAISSSADPTGPWKSIAIPGSPGTNNSADFPTFGLDSQGVYISGDMFDALGNDIGASLLSIPKASLLTSEPSTNGMTRFGILSYDTHGMILQPSICYDGPAGNILATSGLGFDFDAGDFATNTTLVTYSVVNAGGPGTATLTPPLLLSVPGYTAPHNPPQPGGDSDLDDGDSRFSAFVYRVQGILYAIHGTEVENRAALRWYRINATNNTVLEAGTLAHPQLDLFYGSIAANTNGAIVIACNGSSHSTFISSYACVGETVNQVTTFGELVLLESGTSFYKNTDNAFGVSRWGDYSTTSVDPIDPNRFWTIQTIPSAPATWSTQITELRVVPASPVLSIALAGATVVLSWHASATGYLLEFTDNLTQPSWTTVSQSPVISNGVARVQLPVTQATSFFRLHKL